MRNTASGTPAHAQSTTSPAFTPGPWRRLSHRLIVADHGAELPIGEVWSGGVGNDQADANERLIAAAPELHQALTAIMADYRSGLAAIRPSTMNQVVAALAKVEGGAK